MWLQMIYPYYPGYWGDGDGSGTVTATFTWVPDPNNPSEEPTPLSVKEGADVSAGTDGTHPANADDGLGDAPIITTSEYSSMANSHGRHVSQQGKQSPVVITRTLSGQCINGVLLMDYEASIDSRTLTIGCVTNAKVPSLDAGGNATIDANGDQNFQAAPHPLSDGEGDTIYSYNDITTGGEGLTSPVTTRLSFTPKFGGDWHWKQTFDHEGNATDGPDVVNPATWSWSPNESEDTWNYGKWSAPFAQNFCYLDGEPQGTDGTTSKTITYSATDNTDGTSATASIDMQVHDPYEANYPDHITHSAENPRAVSATAISPGTPAGGPVTIQLNVSQSVTYNLTVSVVGPLSEWVANLLGVSLSGSVGGSTTIGYTIPAPDVPQNYGTYAVAYDLYDNHVGKADQWGAGGYVGTVPYNIKVGNPSGVAIKPFTPYFPVSVNGGP